MPVDEDHPRRADRAAHQLDGVGDLAEPGERDDQRHGRHQVQGRRGGRERQAGDGVGPDDEAERGRQQPQVDRGGQRVRRCAERRGPRRGDQGQREDGSRDHRVGGDLQAGVAAEQGLGREVVGPLDDGGGQDDEGRDGEPAGALGQADHGRAGERDDAPGDDGAGRPLLEEEASQQDAEDGGGRDQQARGPGLHPDLAPVEQDLVGGDAGGPAQGDHRQVAAPGRTHPGKRRHQDQRHRRDHDPQEGQRRHAEAVDADPDGGEGRGPEHDGARQGENVSGTEAGGHAATVPDRNGKIQLLFAAKSFSDAYSMCAGAQERARAASSSRAARAGPSSGAVSVTNWWSGVPGRTMPM